MRLPAHRCRCGSSIRACTDDVSRSFVRRCSVRPSRTARSTAAWAIAAASLTVACWATVVAVRDGLSWQGFAREDLGFSIVLVATMPTLGAFVVTRHPTNRLGWLFCLVGPLRGIEVIADVWVRHTYVVDPGSWPAGPVATWLLFAGPLFLLSIAPLMVLWFPDGRAPSARWRRVEIAPIVVVLLLASLLVLCWPLRGQRLLPDPPLVDGWRKAAILSALVASIVIVIGALLAAFASLISRVRRADAVVRAQGKWFLLGAAATFALNLAGDLSPALAPLRLVAAITLQVFIVVAIERYRLWEIDRLINRTIVYGVLTAAGALLYACAAVSVGLIVGDSGASAPVAVASSTLLVAALFAPARRRVQRGVDRRFDRRTFDAVARVREFGDRHDRAPAELRALLAEVLRDPEVALCFETSEGALIDQAGAAIALPSNEADRAFTPVGAVGAPISAVVHRRSLLSDGPLLSDVLRAARSSIERAHLQAELRIQLDAVQRSRARLVEATDAERRRIERDLHDGAQQRLVALALRLRTEQRRRAVAPGTSTDLLLSAAVDELQAAVSELRTMTHGMLPPALSSGGVAAGFRELVGRHDGRVRLLAVPDHRHTPIVEATAWFVASEGLANATKHAAHAPATLLATCEGGLLRVTVVDDGPGGASLDGSGLGGLADRVDACGGRLRLHSPTGGGTELTAELPCG